MRAASWRFLLAGIASIAILAILAAPPARACTCYPQSLLDAFSQSDVIFRGRVLAVLPAPDDEWAHHSMVILTGDKFWKGEPEDGGQHIVVMTYEGTCQFPFTVGGEFLVYGYLWENDVTVTNMCTRTTRFFEHLIDIPFLDSVVSVEHETWTHVKRLYTDE